MITNGADRLRASSTAGHSPSAATTMITNSSNMPDKHKNNCRKAPRLITGLQQSSSGRRKCFLLFTTYTILAIIFIELVLINPSLRPVEAGKKKKIIKKIKEILPLIALLKRKKIVLLPIPM